MTIPSLQKIKEKLKKYPNIQFLETSDSISISPPNESGFEVRFIDGVGKYTVCFKGWHEEFKDVNEALNCFAFGLTKNARLKVSTRGKQQYSWTLQAMRNDEWVNESTTGLLFYPFWIKEKIVYFQNDLI